MNPNHDSLPGSTRQPVSLPDNWLETADQLFAAHREALERARSANLPGPLQKAAELILTSPGKVVITGVGKSGQVAQKIASSLSSTGTPALYLNGSEALHGDLGVVAPGDVVILLSNSGSTLELVKMVPQLKRQRVGLIGILGKTASPLGKEVQVILDSSVSAEGSPHNLAPMASALCALAIGDALTALLMRARNFTPDDFSLLHPAGQLGRNLLLQASEVMHGGEQLPKVHSGATIREVVIEMTRPNLGIVCICNPEGHLEGILTDGDIRRFLTHSSDLETAAETIMTRSPMTVSPTQRLGEALTLMEHRKVYVVPVVNDDRVCVGVLRMHDILQ